jgi:hypothetical protein
VRTRIRCTLFFHSGARALRLRADGADEPLRLAPTLGCCFHVTAGRCHRFSAWVKTALDESAIVLTATEYLFNCSHVTAVHRNAPLQGCNAWRQIAVDFVPGEKAHVVDVALEVYGRGTVWTDDWLFDECPEDERK